MIKNTKAHKFFEQVKQEIQKITWPERKEHITSVVTVVVVVLIFGSACMLVDYSIHKLIKFLLSIGK